MIALLLLCALSTAHPIDPSAVTTSGTLHGSRVSTQLGSVDRYLGVPYAKPPLGELRFAPPEPYFSARHVHTRDYAASCMQPPHLAAAMYPLINRNESGKPISEDCLYLNIYVPTGASGMPVMVWVPGEGYNYASSRQFDGTTLAGFGNVAVVTVNYRVSAFGFLSTGTRQAPGNVGLLDQIAALKWVKENAKSFGGDPDAVTLNGRFTGAMSITALISSPLAMHDEKPLFRSAIVQSGVADAGNWIFDRNPIKAARKLARKVGCESVRVEALLKCMRKVDAETLNSASAYLHSWRLVVGDAVLPEEPMKTIRAGKHLPIPVVVGYTNDEGSLCVLTEKLTKSDFFGKMVDDELDKEAFTVLARGFFHQYLAGDENVDQVVAEAVREYGKSTGTWRDRYVKMCGDVYVKQKIKGFAKQLSIHGSRVYLYEFAHRPEQSFHPDFVRGAHGDDVLFTFGLVRENRKASEAEMRLSDEMMSAWTNFVKHGNPNPMLDVGKEWPAFSIFDKQYWEFSTLRTEKVKSMANDDAADSFLSSMAMTETDKQSGNMI